MVAITNFKDGEVVHNGLVLLKGAAPGANVVIITVEGDFNMTTWPVCHGSFKALVPLPIVKNDALVPTTTFTIKIQDDKKNEARLRIVYTPNTNPRFIRFVYVIAADSELDPRGYQFDAPAGVSNGIRDAVERLQLNGLILQAWLAEHMYQGNRCELPSRYTFRVEYEHEVRAANRYHPTAWVKPNTPGPLQYEIKDADCVRPFVHVIRSSLTTRECLAKSDSDLWYHVFAHDLAAFPERDNSIDVAVFAPTTFDPAQRKPLAHMALGADRLALFGSGSLHTWAGQLREVNDKFTDSRKIDNRTLFDDSNCRGTHWAVYATTLGALLHELCHSLGLIHTDDQHDVMSRGFDFLNRCFVSHENNKPIHAFEEATLSHCSATHLRYSPWLAPDDRCLHVGASHINAEFDRNTQELVIRSHPNHPLVLVSVANNSGVISMNNWVKSENEFRMPISQVYSHYNLNVASASSPESSNDCIELVVTNEGGHRLGKRLRLCDLA